MELWNIKLAKLTNKEKYKPFAKEYGIIVQSMQDTAVINFTSNSAGMGVNVSHKDYTIINPLYWYVKGGYIMCNGGIHTGLKVY
jgi:hypothetical protein